MSAADEIQAAMEALRAEYAADLPALVQALVGRIEEAAAFPAAADEARKQAHRIRGTAGSYGFAAVSEVAGRIEDAIEAGQGVAPEVLGEIAALADQAAGRSSRSSK